MGGVGSSQRRYPRIDRACGRILEDAGLTSRGRARPRPGSTGSGEAWSPAGASPAVATGAMLRFVLLQNRAGKTRLSKYYQKFSEDETRKIEGEVHRIVTSREGANAAAMCSFVEVPPSSPVPLPPPSPSSSLRCLCSALARIAAIYCSPTLRRHSGETTRSCTGGTRGCSSPCASTQWTTSSRTSR
jgi:hypothetical protein